MHCFIHWQSWSYYTMLSISWNKMDMWLFCKLQKKLLLQFPVSLNYFLLLDSPILKFRVTWKVSIFHFLIFFLNPTIVSLLGALLQMGSMMWDGCRKLAPWGNCDHLLFIQVALKSLGCFYLYSFNSLHEQFYNQFLLPKFVEMTKIIASLLLCLFPLPTSPQLSHW